MDPLRKSLGENQRAITAQLVRLAMMYSRIVDRPLRQFGISGACAEPILELAKAAVGHATVFWQPILGRMDRHFVRS